MAKPVKAPRGYNMNLRHEQSRETRRRIVEAARTLYLARGYQAVTMARYAVTQLHSVSLANRYEIALNPLASSPVAAVLGLANPTRTNLGVKVVMDMRLDPGRELWRA